MPTLICDFCSSPNPIMQYPCRSFGLTGEHALKDGAPVTTQGGFRWAKEEDLCLSSAISFQSLGNWAACEACHHLIDQGKIEDLVQRVFAIFRQKDPRLDQALDDLRFAFLFFYEVRTGPPTAIL
jgi:hypothetical protein